MKPTRRQLLASTVALAACRPDGTLLAVDAPSGETGTLPTDTPTGDTGDSGTTGATGDTAAPTLPEGPGPEPVDPWNPPGVVDLTRFPSGVQTGDVLPSAALVSARSDEPALVLLLAQGVEDGWLEVSRLEGLVGVDGVLQLEVDGLVPDTTYSVVVTTPDGALRSGPSRFRTAVPPGASRVVRFGATSCLGSLGAPWRSLSRVAAEKLDVFVLLGDTIYADEGIRPAGWWDHRWADALATEGLRDLTSSTSVVATWDDHEVDNDWSWDQPGMPGDALDALDAFRRSMPLRDGPGGSGLWRSLRWGDTLELFVLDCRGERIDGDYVSREQLDWLKSGLSASTARFKIVINSVPITDMDAVYLGLGADDRWDGYPAQRSEILDHIANEGLTGVLWLGGDFHWGAIATIGRPGRDHEDQLEVFCGPAGSPINPVALVTPEAPQFDPVITRWNSVVFEADPVAGTIRVRFEGDTALLAERTLSV